MDTCYTSTQIQRVHTGIGIKIITLITFTKKVKRLKIYMTSVIIFIRIKIQSTSCGKNQSF